jgi:hypothetical protein
MIPLTPRLPRQVESFSCEARKGFIALLGRRRNGMISEAKKLFR